MRTIRTLQAEEIRAMDVIASHGVDLVRPAAVPGAYETRSSSISPDGGIVNNYYYQGSPPYTLKVSSYQ